MTLENTTPTRFMKCIKDFLVKTVPEDFIVPVGTICEYEGNLPCGTPVVRLDSEEFPPAYSYISKRTIALFNGEDHFEMVTNENVT